MAINTIKAIAVLLMLSFQHSHAQTTYFVDDIIGIDSKNGTNKAMPFKTIERINQLNLKPSDSVLFRQGCQWIGNFIPKGNGVKTNGLLLVLMVQSQLQF